MLKNNKIILVLALGLMLFLGNVVEAETLTVVGSFSNEDKVFEKFTEKTGIEIESLDMSSGEVLTRLKASGGRPMADLWFGGGVDSFIAAKNDDLLEEYKSAHDASIPAKYKDENHNWYGLYLVITGFITNDQILEEENIDLPTKWTELTESQYKDEVLMSNPAISGTNYAILNSILQSKGEEKGWKYFEELSENIPYFSKRGSEPHKKVLLGEMGVGITYINGGIMALPEDNPVSVVFPEDGIPWVPGCMAIFKDAENLDAAQKFVDWTLSEEGQKYIRDLNSTIMVREDVSKPEVLKDFPLDQLLDVNFTEFGSKREMIIEKWNENIVK
ncbi:MAG: ABC transporter substrate-binding protein [Bacillota bacterium]